MLLRRFEAPTLREALRRVERECGRDALVVETRPTRDGFLVVAGDPDGTSAADAAPPTTTDHEPQTWLPRPPSGGPRRRDWTPGFAPFAERALEFGASVDLLHALENALRGTRVHLERPGDPALPALAARVLRGLIPTTDLALPRFALTAVVGPTGVGKTTTLAKLAAQAQRDDERVAVVTLDTYRIAAVEQLRAYAELLQVPFEVAFTPPDLRRILLSWQDRYDRVLVDTTGRSPLDRRALETLRATLAGAAPQTVLCLPATARRGDALDALDAFERLDPAALVLTKWDETRMPGEALSVAIERGLPLASITVGQEVPDDIVPADAEALACATLGVDLPPRSATAKPAAGGVDR